jgi:broad specificity phosphatase PhoE
MIVHLLRHAESSAPAGVAGGWTDWSLSAQGAAAARAAALAWPLPAPARIVTSDLVRAVATAAPLAERHGLACITDPRLRETHLGDWEGLAWATIERDQPERLARWYRDWRSEGPPGGESFADVVARVGSFLDTLDRHPQTLVVAHAGSIRAMLVASGAHDITAAMDLPLPPLGGYALTLRSGAAAVCRALPLPGSAAAAGPGSAAHAEPRIAAVPR